MRSGATILSVWCADWNMGGKKLLTSLWVLPLLLSCWGVVVILSMTGWQVHSPAFKQAIWLGIALVVFILVLCTSFDRWIKARGWLFIGCLGLLLLTKVPGIGVTVKGASRWINLGIMNFQPAEAMAVALPLVLAPVYHKSSYPVRAALATVVVLAPIGLLLMMQPDFGSLLLMVGLAGALFADCYGFLVPLVCLALITPLMVFLATRGYRMDRIEMWRNPWLDPMGAGYQVIQGLIAFANGGLWGIGIHRSQDFLPEVHNDFIFPAMGEQFGLFGTMGTILCFFLLALFAWMAYRRCTGMRRSLIWAFEVSLFLPLFINVGGVTKLIPLSGMPLPFISYGGTSLVFCWIKVGLICRLLFEEGTVKKEG